MKPITLNHLFDNSSPLVASDSSPHSSVSRDHCFVIAEAGVNHNGSLERAIKMVDVAVEAGADAVKFQTFHTEELVTESAPQADYQYKNTGVAQSQYELLKSLELKMEDFRTLKNHCEIKGITFLSTAFDLKSLEFLAELDLDAYKISSGEITNLPLIQRVAGFNRPVILSTGMSNLPEINRAVGAIYGTGNKRLAILHCVSLYPAPAETVNLRAMNTLAKEFNVPVGLSDHSLGVEMSIGAAALGARIIEKHFTLDRTLPGPDHQASLTPGELAQLINAIRNIGLALGNGIKEPTAAEVSTARVARKSLVARMDIEQGTRISKEMLSIKRPGTGLQPSDQDLILDSIATVDIPAGTVLEREMFS